MKLKNYISINKKTYTRDFLRDICQSTNDESLFNEIQECINDGILCPVKNSGTNGNLKFPLYNKYRIITPKADYTTLTKEIRKLYPSMTSNGYLFEKPAEFEKYASELRVLNRYLFDNTKARISISRKERSFEIFNDEKKLDDKGFFGLLTRIGITKDYLSFYDTPEHCFSDYIPNRKSKMTLLICENKDIWFNIRRVMYEESKFELFGLKFDGVIYGQGNMISEAGALTDYTAFLHADQVEYIYWGDIDVAGFDIYLRLIAQNPQLSIYLFAAAYEKMLELSKSRNLPQSEDHREKQIDIESVLSQVATQYREQMSFVLEQNLRLPQEIISYSFLYKNMR